MSLLFGRRCDICGLWGIYAWGLYFNIIIWSPLIWVYSFWNHSRNPYSPFSSQLIENMLQLNSHNTRNHNCEPWVKCQWYASRPNLVYGHAGVGVEMEALLLFHCTFAYRKLSAGAVIWMQTDRHTVKPYNNNYVGCFAFVDRDVTGQLVCG